MEHHACANLEHLFSYSRHFSTNAQGPASNYFQLLEKHGQELVWNLTGIVQTVDMNCANSRVWEWVLLPLPLFKREYWPYSRRLPDVTVKGRVQLPADLTWSCAARREAVVSGNPTVELGFSTLYMCV